MRYGSLSRGGWSWQIPIRWTQSLIRKRPETMERGNEIYAPAIGRVELPGRSAFPVFSSSVSTHRRLVPSYRRLASSNATIDLDRVMENSEVTCFVEVHVSCFG